MLMSIITDICVYTIFFETGRQSLSMLSVLDSNPKTQLIVLTQPSVKELGPQTCASMQARYVCMYVYMHVLLFTGLVVVGIVSQTTTQLSILPLRHIPCLYFVCLLRQTLV